VRVRSTFSGCPLTLLSNWGGKAILSTGVQANGQILVVGGPEPIHLVVESASRTCDRREPDTAFFMGVNEANVGW
jgi:hypothetical protein